MKPTIGIIGGSGLYSMPGFERHEERTVTTPWGAPSDAYIVGHLGGREVAFLARHGRGHRISPSELNFRANIWGMKSLGVERILSLSAVGSLKEEHKPLDFVIPYQFVDRTRGRVSTFFGEGLVAHISFAHPICTQMADVAYAAGQDAGVRNLQEAKLAREAELCYTTIAMVTDYDCWHPEHDAVTVNDIIANLTQNAANAAQLVRAAVAAMPEMRTCKCGSALAHALITDRKAIPEATRKKLELLVGKYVGK
jgi:5'-methylthioadenosine phosphorylase